MRSFSLRSLALLLLAAGAAGAQRSRVVARLADSTFWPEGVDADTVSGRLYVASVRHGTIAEIAPDGSSRELIARDRADIGSIYGVRADPRRGVVWVTTSAAPSLIQLRAADGAVLHRWPVPRASGQQVLGDLAVAPNGDVYFSDSVQPVLYVLRNGADTLTVIHSPLFRSLQGMAPTPDGKRVYLADYSNGLLVLSTSTGAIERVAAPPSVSTRGCDGIVWHEGAIIAVQNGASPPRIVRFDLDATGLAVTAGRIIDRNESIADEPTIGTMLRGEFIYVANSQWEKYDRAGNRIAGRPLTPPVLLGITP